MVSAVSASHLRRRLSQFSRPQASERKSRATAGGLTIVNTSPLDNSEARGDCSRLVSVLFFKRFLQRPFQIASIIPSSKALVERVASKMDFSQPRVIAEYGPGEGVHSREIARRMSPGSHLLLFELDAAFSRALERQFAGDARVHVIHGDAASLPYELKRRGIACCDYILSGIPFSILKIDKKRALLRKTHDALAPGGSFIIYQVTNELKQHATLFEHAESEYFLQNIPPMFITVFQRAPSLPGRGRRAAQPRKVSGLVRVGADRSA
jgi:phosphatidylethanolamine/phosphatidyl-N-methylethanolamine N-methyltransferase